MAGEETEVVQRARSRKAVTRKSRSRSSSKRRTSKSPSRKATSQKSPARSSSKSRKSPARKSDTPKKRRSSSRARKVEEKAVEPSVEVSEEKSAVNSAGDAPSVVSHVETESRTSTDVSSYRRSSRLAAKGSSAEVLEVTSSSVASVEETTVKAFRYEFGGPIGAFLLTFLLPAAVYYLNLSCSKRNCTLMKLPPFPKWQTWFNWKAFAIYAGYVVFLALLSLLPVGKLVKGASPKGAKAYFYRCNGVYSFWACVLLMVGLWYQKYSVVEFVRLNFYALITASTLFSFALSTLLYVRARNAKNNSLSSSASGNFLYDFFMGRELNPRVSGVDLKFFFGLRPGLIGWVLIDLALLLSTLNRNDLLQWPSNPSLVIITLGHAWYVYDALIFEKSFLSTMDITTEGFGFMLTFGDTVWVPFLYTLTARFACAYNPTLSTYQIVTALFLHLLGYTVFRGANSQKDAFRANPYDPRFANLESISTGTNKKRLLAGGWWGLVRKPGYLGDLLMAMSWSLLTGSTHLLPFFYPLYMAVLLVHRERRDHAACSSKYGRHWEAYCDKVRYRIFPYVY